LAEKLGDSGAAEFYNQQAQLIENDLENFWEVPITESWYNRFL